MSQTWESIDGSEYLSDTRQEIVNNFETLRSCFSGTDFPSSPVAGQLFFRTSDKTFWIYDGSNWWQIGAATAHYMGNLPRAGGDSYPMSGDLNVGGNKVVNMASPTDDSNPGDAVNLAYLNSVISGHHHTGASNDGPKINVTDLNGNARAAAHDTSEVIVDTNRTSTIIEVSGVTLIASETKIIAVGCQFYVDTNDEASGAQFTIARDSTTLVNAQLATNSDPEQSSRSLHYCLSDSPGAGTYSYKLKITTDAFTKVTLYHRWIVVF